MATTIYVIRHGETDWNVQGRWQGHADVPLNALGRKQAQALAQRLRAERVAFDAIYSSDLARAYQTAWEVGAVVGVPVQFLPSLREIDLGTWSGMTYNEIKQQHPIEARLLAEGQDIPRGGAETLHALRHRIVQAVAALVRHNEDKTLALVTHGGCIRSLLAHTASIGGDMFTKLPHIGNTSISILRCTGDNWQIITKNDVAHLRKENGEAVMVSVPPDDADRPQEWTP